jgi:alpha-tubulin suppressor-like RCC1 family protein
MQPLAGHRTKLVCRRASRLTVATILATLTMLPAAPAFATPNIAMGWGSNEEGELGNGTITNSDLPVPVSGLSGVTAISAGDESSLALLEDGNVMAWGTSEEGELGDGHFTGSDVPVTVSGLSGEGVQAISAGAEFSLAYAKDGLTRRVYAWGSNEAGQLAANKTTTSDVPVVTKGLGTRTTSAVSAGREFGLALQKEGTVLAWGDDEVAELGDGNDLGYSEVPVAVSGLTGVTAISAGEYHGLALLSNGTVRAWGDNESGQVGNGSTEEEEVEVPVPVSGLTGVTAISAAGEHSLALLSNGTVVAWGSNSDGQLGNGTFTNSDVPVAVSGLSGVTAIAAGEVHSLALLSNGTVMAWGGNRYGQLGNGTTGGNSDVPVTVSGLSGVKGIGAGEGFSLAFGAPPPPPTVTGVAPDEGPQAGGTSVTVSGTNLVLATAVKFGSTSATSFKVNSPGSVTAVSPAGTGPVDVTVSTPGGSSAISSADRFTYITP